MAKNATIATAPRGVCGQPAMARITVRMGADVASTCPVMMTRDICIVNGIRPQNPPPHASTIWPAVAPVQVNAATTTMTVAARAKMKASGIQRSVQAVRARAARPIIG